MAKVRLVKSKKKISEEFSLIFDEELQQWLMEEMRLNKEKPLSLSQKLFWKAPSEAGAHDPRGSPAYVKDYVDTFLSSHSKEPLLTHKPHPNIVDELRGECEAVGESKGENDGDAAKGGVDDDSESEESVPGKFEAIHISEEYSIPHDASLLQ